MVIKSGLFPPTIHMKFIFSLSAFAICLEEWIFWENE